MTALSLTLRGYAATAPELWRPHLAAAADAVEELARTRAALAEAQALLKNTRSDIVAVCCDHDGRVCFNGSEGDRRVVQEAIAAIDAALAAKEK